METTLPGLVLSKAAKCGALPFLEAWALDAGVTERLTFAQLADAMVDAASWLRSEGLRNGEYCGLLAHNSPSYVAISLGAMQLGAVSVNLNWMQPSSVHKALLVGLGARLLCVSDGFQKAASEGVLPIAGLKPLRVEDLARQRGRASAAERAELEARVGAVVRPDAPAVVFFTSGTTGMPKAVPHTHAGLLWHAASTLATFPAPFGPSVPQPGTLCFTPFFHVMGFVGDGT